MQKATKELGVFAAALLLALIGVAFAGYAVFGPTRQSSTNAETLEVVCVEIEKVKTQLREDAVFNEPETRRLLADVNIDPDSEAGQRLIRRGREQAAQTQQRFAPLNC